MQGNEKWPPGTNPSAKLRAARAMPSWLQARGMAIPPPPPPPPNAELPPPPEPEYEVIEFGQTYSNQPAIKNNKEKKRCDLCGSSVPAVKCMQCVQQNFCYSCDEMYHRHPKRQTHVRKELDGGGIIGGGRLPPLPPKGEPPPPPVPPPRRHKRAPPRPNLPPPTLPQGPHLVQRDSVSPKPGFVGSLKRIMGGVRPLPGSASHTLDRQNSLPPSTSMMNFHDQQMMNGVPPDWMDMHRGHRSGSFSALNPPSMGHMMQAQSMAQLNCPSCHGHGMWSPWSGMPASHQWHSNAFLGRGPDREDWSGSDSGGGEEEESWRQERMRRFSTVSGRGPRQYPVSEETASLRGGSRRRQEWDTMSSRGGSGRRLDPETMSNRGGGGGSRRRQDWDTLSTRGGPRRQDFETMSLRGGRRSDLDSPSLRSHRKINDKHRKDRYRDLSDSSDERESEEEMPPIRTNKKISSDVEESQKHRRRSEPPSPVPTLKKTDSSRKKNRRSERFSDTGRRRSSPVNYKYESPSEEDEPELTQVLQSNDKSLNGIEFIDAEAEDEKEEVASIPDIEWECVHCTYVNEGGTRVCAICCKTCTRPKSKNNLTKSAPQIKPSSPAKPTVQISSSMKVPSPTPKLEEETKKLNLDDKQNKEDEAKKIDKSEKTKERRGSETQEKIIQTHTTSTGTSPPPQSISTQTYEEGGRKLKRATSLADYSDWKAPQRSASRQSLVSDTQSLPVTPPRSRSPEHFQRPKIVRRQSDLYLNRNQQKRGSSQPPEYLSSLVQKQVKQGLEMVKLLRDAEENQFTAEDLAVSLVHCGDDDPITWLQENWRNMIDTVVTLGTNYGQERKENTVGTISASEAREALRLHDGNVWAAVTECVEQRQKKYADLLSRGNFSREDIVTVLTAHHGDVEEAYKELNKNQLRPFLMRIWGPPQGADNDDGDYTKLAHGETEGRGGKNSEEVSEDLSFDSGYERIQNWLEDYVHSNFYMNQHYQQSQALLQPNHQAGLKRSTSHKRINNPSISSKSNSPAMKDRRYSDIHRYLTALYDANDKTLLLNKHSSDINKNQNNVNSNNNTRTEIPSESKTKNFNEGNNLETITIKLNPTIMKNDNKIINSKGEEYLSSEESSMDSESIDELESPEIKRNKKPMQNLKNSESAMQQHSSELDSEPSDHELSHSESQTSNESFESLHSAEDGVVKQTKKKNQSDLKSDQNTQELNAYENFKVVTEEGGKKMLSNPQRVQEMTSSDEEESSQTSEEEANINALQKELFKTNENLPTISVNTQSNEGLSHARDTSTSTNNSEDKYEEVPSDEDVVFIDDISDNPQSSDVEIKESPVVLVRNSGNLDTVSKEIPAVLGRNSGNPDVDSKESPVVLIKNSGSPDVDLKEKRPRLIKDPTTNGNQQLTVPNDRQRKNVESTDSMSLSELNEEQSPGISEGSTDYIGEKRTAKEIATLKQNKNGRLSEANSDRDVSPIPTDSEKESAQANENRGHNGPTNVINNPLHVHQLEILDLLKKSLTKDDVMEKLVTTLLASVLQVNVDKKEKVSDVENITTFPEQVNVNIENKERSIDQPNIIGEVDAGTLNSKKEEHKVNPKETVESQTIENSKNLPHVFKSQSIDENTKEPSGQEVNDYRAEGKTDAINIEKNKSVEVCNRRLDDTKDKPMSQPSRDSNSEPAVAQKLVTDHQEIKTEDKSNKNTMKEAEVQETNLKKYPAREEVCNKIIKNPHIENQERGVDQAKSEQTQQINVPLTQIKNEIIHEKHVNITTSQISQSERAQAETTKLIKLSANSKISGSKKAISIPPLESQVQPNSESIISGTEFITEDDLEIKINENQEDNYSPQREARRLLAEGLVMTYQQAEIAVGLKQLKIDGEEQIMAAAKECNSLDSAIAYLQQECQLCAGKYSAKQIVSMLKCEHSCCTDCASNYFTLQITERSINDCVCPFCKEPDILHGEEDEAQTYFSHLDIFLKGIVKENVHELFQRKLRDRTLMKDPNFRWCPKCSSGFIANPTQKRLTCPDCKAVSCAKCLKPWEDEHDNRSCEEYSAWAKENDPENLLSKHLDENGVTCPKCKAKYLLAKGGCMHLTCPQCKHEFCSGCSKPFLMGRRCRVSDYCDRLGLHSHHPRNCLFYLRDKEPEELEHFLDENNIAFDRTDDSGSTTRCNVQMLRETPEGDLVEGICGYATFKAGFCRTHYIENLATRVRLSKVDPVKLLDFNEAVQEVRRHGLELPHRPSYMSEYNYRQILYQVIEREIPLD